jgi:hypothetical protein
VLSDIDPWDDLEVQHLSRAVAWIDSGAPLYRIAKPNVPDPHRFIAKLAATR